MKIGFYTLGCKVNQYETQAMEQLFAARGCETADFREACDGYIINTCSVTAIADKKNRAIIRRCRKAHPNAVLGVCGCYPQHAQEALAEFRIDVLGGSGSRQEFVEAMLEALSSRRTASLVDEALRRRSFEQLPAGGLSSRTRALLKVQDGCVNFCTYCIIPYVRGPVRSAPAELVLRQARELAEKGYKELVITGIEISSWGIDLLGKPALETLLGAVCEAVPGLRVRLGSLEPRVVTEEFCRALQNAPNLCHHFHLSMQSGCDSVLARMKRKYTTQQYLESVQLLRQHFPGCAVTTDMIVAFPGETEKEYMKSLEFIKQCDFADMHIFPYSRRPGTPADKLPGQHDNATKERRSRKAISVAQQMAEGYRLSLVGQTLSVLFEEQVGAYYTGHAENSVRVYAHGEQLHNQVHQVHIVGLHEDGLLGKI